jgi:mannitol/fructose-specific phosphotransferase system IIA component (Ntr-type)
MAAARYPLAMARDRLFPERFERTGSRGTPVLSIVLTTGILALMLITLDVMEVAELASALQLLVFGLVNLAVIVMRESRIESYDPGFRSPFYPWTQLAGVFVSLVLVAEMGWIPVLFTVGVTAACFGWYNYWARERTARDGAIFHVFERLGRRRFQGLDRELRDIMKEKGARDEDPFDEVVAQAPVIDVATTANLSGLITDAAAGLAVRLPVTADQLETAFVASIHGGATPVARGAALVHTRLAGFDGSELLICRCAGGVHMDLPGLFMEGDDSRPPVRAIFFLVSDEDAPGRHLRILAQLAGRIEESSFMEQWLASGHEHELKEVLLRDDHFFSVSLLDDSATASLIGVEIRHVVLPGNSLVALIRRGDGQIVPRGGTRLQLGDRLTFIGDKEGIRELQGRYGRD